MRFASWRSLLKLSIPVTAGIAYVSAPLLRRFYRIPSVEYTNDQKNPNAIRIGILGAANVAPLAVIYPARHSPDFVIESVASRSRSKAEKYAEKHGINRVSENYDSLLNDPNIDAVYNSLPNGLHHEWTMKALAAGKHVLCEKPFANNAEEAQEMYQAALTNNCVLMEAFHTQYHPAARRTKEIVHSEIGEITDSEASFMFPGLLEFGPDDIRFNYALGGGSLMDDGCYLINLMRYVMGVEPTVISAEAVKWDKDERIDLGMTGNLSFDFGGDRKVTGATRSALDYNGFQSNIRVVGTNGSVKYRNFVAPYAWHVIEVYNADGSVRRKEKVYGNGETTYECMMDHFVEAIKVFRKSESLDEVSVETDGEDAVKNMKVIDEMYRVAGMDVRGL